MNTVFDPAWLALVVFCWLVVALGATVAVFSPHINDTVSERICLGAVALAALGTAYRVYETEHVTDGFRAVSIALAAYVFSIFWKHRPAAWRRKS